MKNEIVIQHSAYSSEFVVEVTCNDDELMIAGRFSTPEKAMEKVNQLLDENPEYFYDEDVNTVFPKKIDQYELKHKMTSVQCKLFKSYLHHEENISYEDMLVGDHGDEGKDLVLFNVSELKAKSVQKLQDEFVIPLKNLSSAVDEIQKLASKSQFLTQK